MTPNANQQTEISYIDGITTDGKVAAISDWTWQPGTKNPAVFSSSTIANSGSGKWGSASAGVKATISYSFDPTSQWTTDEQTAWKAAMGLWSEVANVSFSPALSSAKPDFNIVRAGGGAAANFATTTQSVGSSVLPQATSGTGYIEFDTNDPSFGPLTTDYGNKNNNYPFGSAVHELGHMIGLGHAGPYNSTVDPSTQQFSNYDSLLWSTMSYIASNNARAKYYNDYTVTGTDWGGLNSPQTPMILDIQAAQALYGTPTTGPLTAGGQIFGFNSNITGDAASLFNFTINKIPILTIWDGGQNNTLDLSGFAQNAIINLEPGTYTSAAGMVNNIGIAFNTSISTAIGGAGSDVINGYGIACTMKGNAGNDAINGGNGFNTSVYNGVINAYAATIESNLSTFKLYDKVGTDGLDTLSNIQQLTFSNQSYSTADFSTVRSLTKLGMDIIVDLYNEIFLRAADSTGLIFWGSQNVKGQSLQNIAAIFLNSAEGQQNYSPNLSTQDFVKTAYLDVFNRQGDSGGVAYWSGLIDSGQISRSDLFLAFSQAPTSTSDGMVVSNKMTVGGQFSVIQGLNNNVWAKQVLANVDSTAASLTAALNLVQSYAVIAATPSTSEFTVKVLGIDDFLPLPG